MSKMKTRKSDLSNKSKSKTKPNNKMNSLRNTSKVKTQNVISSERVCNRCKSHEIIASIKGHKCPYIGCDCLKCKDYEEKTRRKREMASKRRKEKNELKDGPKAPKSETISFVNSLKNKSKKILNKKKSNKKKVQTVGSLPPQQPQELHNRSPVRPSAQAEDQHMEANVDSPPRLVRQQSFSGTPRTSTQANSAGASTSGGGDECQTYPIKSSASLCAQYLKACGELSRKLSKYELTEDEMIACFKYSTIRDCLGDVEMAAQKIAFASQEIRLGAAFNIQHPMDDHKVEAIARNSSPQRGEPPEAGTKKSSAPMLCSTYNQNFRENNAINYSPAFTPIRRN